MLAIDFTDITTVANVVPAISFIILFLWPLLLLFMHTCTFQTRGPLCHKCSICIYLFRHHIVHLFLILYSFRIICTKNAIKYTVLANQWTLWNSCRQWFIAAAIRNVHLIWILIGWTLGGVKNYSCSMDPT